MNDIDFIDKCKLIFLCNTIRTTNSFTRSEIGVVIDSKQYLIHMCKASLVFAPLAVCVQTGCSAFPFYTPNKWLIRLHIKYKTALFL